jgi:phosphoglycerate dehydrogenase-like enzyme
MRILATDPYLDKPTEPGVELVSLERLLRESDLVTLHVPLSAETRKMIGTRELACMKPSAVLVNTSRGPVVDEEALIAAIAEDRIGGAALDVAFQEPIPPLSPLRTFPNVILTPHNAYHSEDGRSQLHATVADSVEALMRGYWPPFPANPNVHLRTPLRPWAAFADTRR